MSNQWLRLWHEMPTDPKWRTIARISGQPISLVQAAYVHLLVDASRNVTRGHATVTQEDLASALDVTEEAIEAILDAMQGRVLDGMKLLGWEKRQPKREDSGGENSGAKSAAQRKREQREREKASSEQADSDDGVTQCHDESRNVTLDKEEIREEVIPPIPPKGATRPAKTAAVSLQTWLVTIKAMGEKAIPDDDPVRAYAAEVGIPDDLMRLAWFEFRHRYSEPGAKRYKDWRAVFRKAVRGNWMHLWFHGDDGYVLTTAGHQAKAAMEAAA